MQKIELYSRPELFRGCAAPGVRMNQGLLDFYSKTEGLTIRAKSSSAVRIVFETDALELDYTLTFGKVAREIYTSDIIINGKTTVTDGAGPHKITMEPGRKEVIIHLPHLVIVEKIELAVNDGAYVKALPASKKKLLFCGDSIMQGMTCTTPSKAVGSLLADKLDMEIHNTSVGGATMQPDVVKHTLALGGDVIVVGFGINDAAQLIDPVLFRERTREVLTMLNDFPGKAFIIVPISCLRVLEKDREAYSAIIREEHEKFPGITLIEGASFYPAQEEYFVDGVHPNDAGMKLYADALAGIMLPTLQLS